MSESPESPAETGSEPPQTSGKGSWRPRLLVWSFVLLAVIGGATFAYMQGQFELPRIMPRTEAEALAHELLQVGGVVTFETDKDGDQITSVYLGNKYSGGEDKLALVTKLPRVEDVMIESLLIDDAGMKTVSQLKDLRILKLNAPKVTNAGIAKLAHLQKLEGLYISNLPLMTDEAVKDITRIKGLKKLYLQNTGITDAVVESLKELPGLVELDLYDTQVTKAGILALQEALPNTEIEPPHDVRLEILGLEPEPDVRKLRN